DLRGHLVDDDRGEADEGHILVRVRSGRIRVRADRAEPGDDVAVGAAADVVAQHPSRIALGGEERGVRHYFVYIPSAPTFCDAPAVSLILIHLRLVQWNCFFVRPPAGSWSILRVFVPSYQYSS